jgi:hypothetical protein
MAAWTLSFSRLISATIFFAVSCGMPLWKVIFCRTLPPEAGSTSPLRIDLRCTPRRTSLVSTTSRACRSSSAFRAARSGLSGAYAKTGSFVGGLMGPGG